jgi:hypothetical protein
MKFIVVLLSSMGPGKGRREPGIAACPAGAAGSNVTGRLGIHHTSQPTGQPTGIRPVLSWRTLKAGRAFWWAAVALALTADHRGLRQRNG